jgi:maltooligosyltrehalose trehalohydrolase
VTVHTKTETFGATLVDNGQVEFRVWAPAAKTVVLRLLRRGRELQDLEMRNLGSSDFGMPDFDEPSANTFSIMTEAAAGDRYFYIVDGQNPVPDPVSRLLPEGVHGATEIVDPNKFQWTDHAWGGMPLQQYVIYELHVGTFTPQGTFDGAISKLDYLRELGVTAIELMPVSAFPGARNWGYDGVSLYALQASYGGPDGLWRLVDEAHRRGLAVIQDVVYNHFGPEGNYLRMFGPYFTGKHHTPWGEAVNYDDEGREGMRRLVVENALYWIREYHMDGLRLDAIQTIKDDSDVTIVEEIAHSVHSLGRELGREVVVIGETDENDPGYVLPSSQKGRGLDAVWSDDFHHAVHAHFTGERAGYYQDFGEQEQIAKALGEGFVFQGEFFKFWNDVRGACSEGMPAWAHVICLQNHDQVGNRALGERLTHLVSRGVRKMMAAFLLLAPQTPLIFMGQEFDAETPFQFFTDFGDPALRKAVTEGRRKEFKQFREFASLDVPDPQDPATFERSRLKWEWSPAQREMHDWYRKLLTLRAGYVSNSERTCEARVVGEMLEMKLPRGDGKLRVTGGRSGFIHESQWWHTVLQSNEDGYEVRVEVKD